MSVNIACLGWGSLIWDETRPFAIRSDWLLDGPRLPIEFARQSQGDRLTLVIEPTVGTFVQVLWALMEAKTLDGAVMELKNRECKKLALPCVHHWCVGDSADDSSSGVAGWAKTKEMDAVIWTSLGPRFNKDERPPSEDEAVAYLYALTKNGIEAKAKEYFQNAPIQIETAYRARIRKELGWH